MYPVSCVNATDVHTVPASRCRRRRGLLAPGEMVRVEAALRLMLGL